MNFKLFTEIVPGFLLLLILSVSLYAQENQVDQDRMNRDIRIMESALEELFRVENRSGTSLRMPGFTLAGSYGTGRVTGIYLSGYGIIFTVPDVTAGFFGAYSLDKEGDESGSFAFVFSADGNSENNSISENGIKDRITDFLVNYAPSISQLGGDERVLVIYGADLSRRGFVSIQPGAPPVISGHQGRIAINRVRSEDSSDKPGIPIISMSVKKSDLDALRTGRINESSFTSRIETVTKSREESGRHVDLDVFASVLETGLKDNSDTLFRINRKPTHLYLDNFGVMYQLELSHSPGFYIGDFTRELNIQVPAPDFMDSFRFEVDNFRFEIDSLRIDSPSDFLSDEERERMRKELEEARKKVEEARKELEERMPEIRERGEEARQRAMEEQRRIREQMEEQREKARDPEAVRQSLENRIQMIKELIVDYGRTLSSLQNDQFLLLTVNVTGRRDAGLPTRIDLKVSKADLEQMGRGAITREQALERIVERRF